MIKCAKHILFTAVSMVTFGCAMAQCELRLNDILNASLPIRNIKVDVCRQNPATMVFSDTISLSTVRIGTFYNTQSKPVLQQLGSGSRLISVSAESYTIFSPRTTVWGSAEFTTGNTKNIKWTDCIDFLRVAPYVLGDNTGGDLSSRKYSFNGGYGGTFGRWTVGAEAFYRAEIAYRNQDPRLKTIVSNLKTSIGTSLLISRNYAIGISAGLDIYRQNCDLDFYNPLNDINTYPLTGLGTFYKRFTGNANKSSGYQSNGFTGGLQLISLKEEGFNAAINYSSDRMEQLLRSYNNLTLAYTNTSYMSLDFSYRCSLSKSVRTAPSVSLAANSRKGTENLFGTSSGASYEIIGSRANYKQNIKSINFTCPFEFGYKNSCFAAVPGGIFTTLNARIIDPSRKLSISGLTPQLKLQYSAFNARSVFFKSGIDMSYSFNNAPASKNNILEQAATISVEGLGECLAENFRMLKANRFNAGINTEMGKMINRVLYHINISYNFQNHIAQGNAHTISVAIGATF